MMKKVLADDDAITTCIFIQASLSLNRRCLLFQFLINKYLLTRRARSNTRILDLFIFFVSFILLKLLPEF